jgi:signal transduction histidine kinase
VKRARLEIVRTGDNRVQIVVQDEGEGLDLAVLEARMADEDAFGLFAIRERLQLIGGRIQLESLLGKGTCVTLVAPLTST